MTVGFNLKGQLGIVIYTFFAIAFFFLFAYILALLMQTMIGQLYGIKNFTMPRLAAIHVDLLFFAFVAVVSQIADRAVGEQADYFSASGWSWTALLILLSTIPSMANVALLSSSDQFYGNLVYCPIQFNLSNDVLLDVNHSYRSVLIFDLTISMLVSYYIATKLNIHRSVENTVGGVTYKRYSFVSSAVSVFVAGFALSIYLIVNHTLDSGLECISGLATRGPNIVVTFFLIIVILLLVVAVAKVYSFYIFIPWALSKARGWPIHTIQIFWLLIIIVFFSRVFSDSVGVILTNAENLTIGLALKSVIASFLNAIRVMPEYFYNFLQFIYAFILKIYKFLPSIGTLYSIGIANVYVPLMLLSFGLIIIASKFTWHLKKAYALLKILLSSVKNVLSVLAPLIAILIAALAFIYLLVLPVKDWILEEYFSNEGEEIEENSRPSIPIPELKNIELTCKDGEPAWSFGRNDKVEMDLWQCEVAWSPGVDICMDSSIVAIGVSSAHGEKDVELARAKARGIILARYLLREYQLECVASSQKPSIYVLNLGQPIRASYDSRNDRKLQAHLAKHTSDINVLSDLLKTTISESKFTNWEVIEVSDELN